jgi:hypothetical protein
MNGATGADLDPKARPTAALQSLQANFHLHDQDQYRTLRAVA